VWNHGYGDGHNHILHPGAEDGNHRQSEDNNGERQEQIDHPLDQQVHVPAKVGAGHPDEGAQEGRDEDLRIAIYTLLDSLRGIAVLTSFALPVTAGRLWERLGLDGGPTDEPLPCGARQGALPAGIRVSKGEVLFPRVEPDEA
jgi:hypothetical protein